MSDSRKFLKQIQEDAYARIEAAEECTNVSLILERKAVAEADVKKKLATQNGRGGKVGTCVIVEMPTIIVDSPEAPGPLTQIAQSFLVLEHPETNSLSTGSGISAEQIAMDVLQLFHRFIPYGVTQVFTPERAAIVPDFTYKNLVGYRVTITAPVAAKARRKVTLPTISPQTGAAPLELTLACATSGADIYYTTDGSYPSAANTAAQLYSAPFTLAEAATVRVAAQKAGMQQSDVAQFDFS